MSLVINRDEINTILMPDEENDAITTLIKQIKGAVLVSIEGDDWFVLIRQGEKFVWVDLIDAIPFGSEKDYSGQGNVVSIKPKAP